MGQYGCILAPSSDSLASLQMRGIADIGLTSSTAAIASMAEMASMAPTTGGQYHWVSEFAPKSAQRELSYLVGWLCVL